MNTYTVSHAYKLGDQYRYSHQWLAAELCYALPLIKDHQYNTKYSMDIIPDKLPAFLAFRNANKFKIPRKGADIPSDASELLKSFYSLWLNTKIKNDLIKRSEEHTSKRCETVIQIFQKVTNTFENIGDLDISLIEKELLTKHCVKIDNWKGPSFTKLQYRKKSTNLTVVMEYKDYRNRCMNSQEDWFKKYDGIFFARCLTEIADILRARLSSIDFELIAMTFAKELLFCKIQFPFAAPRLLLPAGTLFNCDELQDALNKFHPHLNAKYIRQKSVHKRVRDYHAELLERCEYEYTIIIRNRINTLDHIHQPVVHEGSVKTEYTPSYQHNQVYNEPYIEPNMYHYTAQYPPQQMCVYQECKCNHYQSPQTTVPMNNMMCYNNNDYMQRIPHQQQPPMDTMNDDTGSTISICTECGEQQCRCNMDNVSVWTHNLNQGGRQFQAINFPRLHRNVNHFSDRDQRLSLHIQTMRTPQMFDNTHTNR